MRVYVLDNISVVRQMEVNLVFVMNRQIIENHEALTSCIIINEHLLAAHTRDYIRTLKLLESNLMVLYSSVTLIKEKVYNFSRADDRLSEYRHVTFSHGQTTDEKLQKR